MGSIRAARTAVEVEVYDRNFEGVPSHVPQRQWRAYSWNGDGFAQTGGPTEFPPNPYVTDLSVTGGNLTLRPAEGNRVAGSLTLSATDADGDSILVEGVTGCPTVKSAPNPVGANSLAYDFFSRRASGGIFAIFVAAILGVAWLLFQRKTPDPIQ